MTKFYSLQVKDIKKETADCVSIGFDVPQTLKDKFVFTQGQYLTFRTQLNGTEVRRSYSICSAVGEDLRVAIKKIDGGLFSTFANDILKNGDSIETMPPSGRFCSTLDEKQAKNYVAFASGSGITPIFSILKTVLAKELNSTFALFYGNKNANSTIFKKELDVLKEKYANRLDVFYVYSREENGDNIFNGRITSAKVNEHFAKVIGNKTIDELFLCGPEEMVLDLKNAFLTRGLNEKNIHLELFTTSAALHTEETTETNDNQTFSEVEVQVEGEIYTFSLAQNGQSILDAAMAQGADLPFACKGGVCCTCKCKVIEGEVHMVMNYGLDPDEVEDGYVLSCQTHPRSEKVVIDFDV